MIAPTPFDLRVEQHLPWARRLFVWAPIGAWPYHGPLTLLPAWRTFLVRRQGWCVQALGCVGDDVPQIKRIVRHSLRVFPPKEPMHGSWLQMIDAALVLAMLDGHTRAQEVLLATRHAHLRWPFRADRDEMWRLDKRLAGMAAAAGCVEVFAHMWRRMFMDEQRMPDPTACALVHQLDLIRTAVEHAPSTNTGCLDWIAQHARPCRRPMANTHASVVAEFSGERQKIWMYLAGMKRADVAVVALGMLNAVVDAQGDAFRAGQRAQLPPRTWSRMWSVGTPPRTTQLWQWAAKGPSMDDNGIDAWWWAALGVEVVSAFCATHPDILDTVCRTPMMTRWADQMRGAGNSFLLTQCRTIADPRRTLEVLAQLLDMKAFVRAAVEDQSWEDLEFVLTHVPDWAHHVPWDLVPPSARAGSQIAAAWDRRALDDALGAVDTHAPARQRRM